MNMNVGQVIELAREWCSINKHFRHPAASTAHR